MRIRMLEDVASVGVMLTAGELVDVQDPLAMALIMRGQAEDPCKVCVVAEPEAAEAAPAEVVEVEEDPVEAEVPEAPEPEPKPKPKKGKAK
jgi:hypothetical protein